MAHILLWLLNQDYVHCATVCATQTNFLSLLWDYLWIFPIAKLFKHLIHACIGSNNRQKIENPGRRLKRVIFLLPQIPKLNWTIHSFLFTWIHPINTAWIKHAISEGTWKHHLVSQTATWHQKRIRSPWRGREEQVFHVISRDGEAVMQRNRGWQCQRAGMDLDSPL